MSDTTFTVGSFHPFLKGKVSETLAWGLVFTTPTPEGMTDLGEWILVPCEFIDSVFPTRMATEWRAFHKASGAPLAGTEHRNVFIVMDMAMLVIGSQYEEIERAVAAILQTLKESPESD